MFQLPPDEPFAPLSGPLVFLIIPALIQTDWHQQHKTAVHGPVNFYSAKHSTK